MPAEPMTTLTWPELPEPFNQALHDAVDAILVHVTPVGIIAGGSILRGEGGPTSDIDIYVIHLAPWRQRLQRRFSGVPCEIFINPPQQIRRYFEEEHSRRPITAHLFVTGFVVLDRDPVVQSLRNDAATWLETPPNPPADSLRWQRYEIVDLLDNARDLVKTDSHNADMILHQAAHALIDYAFLVANRPLPRSKATLRTLRSVDPAAAALAQRYYAAKSADVRLIVAEQWAQHLLGVTRFFEWDSEPETVAS